MYTWTLCKQGWYDKPITVILLRQESTLNAVEKATKIPATKRSHRPIGLAKDKFQVSNFFDELPENLLNAFEGKKL